MQDKKQILPGTKSWEDICEQCGICCLIKYRCPDGRIFLTNVRCKHLGVNRKCDCYSPEFNKRDSGDGDTCAKCGGSPVTLETLNKDYPVPGFCPYVKQCVGPNNLQRPDIDFAKTVSESDLSAGADLSDYIIPGTARFFNYLKKSYRVK